MSLYFLLMSYSLKILGSIFIIFGIIFPRNSFADSQPVINEFLAHPSSNGKEWVEFYNPDFTNMNGYWIDDDTDFGSDAGSSSKKQITSVIQGSDSSHTAFILDSSMFNNDGDTIALFASDGILLDHYAYAQDPGEDISIGRTPDGIGDFQVLTAATQGGSNSSPKPPDTPKPAPTDKPTKEPNPTETPKPAKTTTSVTTSLTTKNLGTNQSVLADSITNADLKSTSLTTKRIGSNGAYPTSIIQKRTVPTKDLNEKYPQKRVLVKGVSTAVPQFIFVSLGGVLFICCGILLYLKKRRLWPWKM